MKKFITNLTGYREEIDLLDIELLRTIAARIKVIEKVGKFKKKNGLKPLDKKRWQEVLQSRIKQGKVLNINPELIKKIFEAIHEESLRIESSPPLERRVLSE